MVGAAPVGVGIGIFGIQLYRLGVFRDGPVILTGAGVAPGFEEFIKVR